MPTLRRLLAEPLVHFVLLGGVVFGLDAIVGAAAPREERRIDIGAAELARLHAAWMRQWGREPGPAQMRELIASHVREEVLVREAVAQGLDRDDTIVRRRLAQKMEFLAQEGVQAPTEAELMAYHRAHPKRYASPPQLALETIRLRPEYVRAAGGRELQRLQSGKVARDDDSLLPQEWRGQTEALLARDFGADFARAVFALPAGAWAGPIESPLGPHLVRVTSRRDGGAAEFAEVRERVRADMLNERVAEARERAFARASQRYRVVVDGELWPRAAGSGPTVSEADDRVSRIAATGMDDGRAAPR